MVSDMIGPYTLVALSGIEERIVHRRVVHVSQQRQLGEAWWERQLPDERNSPRRRIRTGGVEASSERISVVSILPSSFDIRNDGLSCLQFSPQLGCHVMVISWRPESLPRTFLRFQTLSQQQQHGISNGNPSTLESLSAETRSIPSGSVHSR